MEYLYPLLIGFALAGVAYFYLYRIVFYKNLKWKMLHSIWLPVVYAVIFVLYALYLKFSPVTGGSMADLAAIPVLVIFNIPVVSFFILYFIYTARDKKTLVSK